MGVLGRKDSGEEGGELGFWKRGSGEKRRIFSRETTSYKEGSLLAPLFFFRVKLEEGEGERRRKKARGKIPLTTSEKCWRVLEFELR